MAKKTCGAKTRAGKPCQAKALGANGRCRKHGGFGSGPPEGSQNAATHGIYARGLQVREAEAWDAIPLGTLDHEIKLCRVQLARVVEQQLKAEDNPDDRSLLELSAVSEETGSTMTPDGAGEGGEKARRVIKRNVTLSRPDYRSLVLRLTGRIADLECRRAAFAERGRIASETVTISRIFYAEKPS